MVLKKENILRKVKQKVFNIEKLKNHFDLNNIIIYDTKDDTDKEDMTLDDDIM